MSCEKIAEDLQDSFAKTALQKVCVSKQEIQDLH